MISFIINKTLISEILLKPRQTISGELSSIIVDNFKSLATVLHRIARLGIYDYSKENLESQDDNITDKLYKIGTMKLILDKDWLDEMKELLHSWTNKWYEIFIKAKKLNE